MFEALREDRHPSNTENQLIYQDSNSTIRMTLAHISSSYLLKLLRIEIFQCFREVTVKEV